MDYERSNQSYVETFMHSLVSKIWRQLRPFIKAFIRVIIRFESRIYRHSERLESGISYIYERLEIPILLIGMFFGTIFAFITGSLAGVILVPFAVTKSWPIVSIFAPKVGAHLWNSLKNLPLSVVMGVAEFLWPISEPGTKARPGPANATPYQRHPRQTFFLSDAGMESRSSDEMEVVPNASGSWKVSDTVDRPQLRLDLTSDLRINSSPTRRHRRRGTGSSSISLSGTSSPELIRTPLIVNSEGRDGYHRRHRSGSSSPESYFRMTALYSTDRTQSASDLRRHRRSGSSSAASVRSQGLSRVPDRT